MKFDQTTRRILCAKPDEELDEEAKREIAQSDDLAKTAAEWRAFGSLAPDRRPPPLSTDFMIINEAAKVAQTRFSRRRKVFWFIGLAAAACLVLACLLGVGLLRLNNRPVRPSKPLMSSEIAQAPRISKIKPQNISWNQIDMTDDFFEVETEIELCLVSVDEG